MAVQAKLTKSTTREQSLSRKDRRREEGRNKSVTLTAVPQTAQVSLLGNRQIVQTEPKATEQVAYLLRKIQKKGQIFLPLEMSKDRTAARVFEENRSPPEDSAGTVVFSKNGFVAVAGAPD